MVVAFLSPLLPIYDLRNRGSAAIGSVISILVLASCSCSRRLDHAHYELRKQDYHYREPSFDIASTAALYATCTVARHLAVYMACLLLQARTT